MKILVEIDDKYRNWEYLYNFGSILEMGLECVKSPDDVRKEVIKKNMERMNK